MHTIFIGICAVILLGQTSKGYILDGTITPTTIYNTYIFSDGDSAVGDVYFKKGFTVPADATVTFNINTPIDGAINLNGTGQIVTSQVLRLGHGATGFPHGGIIKATSLGTTQTLLEVHNDISIGGQLVILDKRYPAINMKGNTLTLLEDGPSRGSFLIKNTTWTGEGYGDLRFVNGVVLGLEDFKDGGGARIRVSAVFEPSIWMQGATFVLAPESTMTCTSYNLAMPTFFNHIKTPSRATVNALSGVNIYSEASLFLWPGITLRETDSATWPWGLAWDDFGTFFGLDNATVEMQSFRAGGNGSLLVKGKSYMRGIGVTPSASLFARDITVPGTNIDIAGGATLICDNISMQVS
jgi:hypothetical protein